MSTLTDYQKTKFASFESRLNQGTLTPEAVVTKLHKPKYAGLIKEFAAQLSPHNGADGYRVLTKLTDKHEIHAFVEGLVMNCYRDRYAFTLSVIQSFVQDALELSSQENKPLFEEELTYLETVQEKEEALEREISERSIGKVLDADRYKRWLKEAPAPVIELSWDELQEILTSSLVFRHVSSHEKAEEAQQGFRGDAVSLSQGIYSTIYGASRRNLLSFSLPRIEFDADICRSTKEALANIQLTDDDKVTILRLYQQNIWEFILNSLVMDHQVDPMDPLEGWLEEKRICFRSTTAFLLLQKENHNPYDIARYFCLGKIGKQNFAPADHRKTILPSSTVPPLTEGEFTDRFTTLFHAVAADFFTQTIRETLELSKSCHTGVAR